jgi:hypothetical protein
MFHIVHVWWFRWWWPSDLGNGPESLQELGVGAIITSLLYPPIRNAIKREIHKIHVHIDRLEHVASGKSPEDFVAKEFKEFEHWVVTFFKWITKPFRKATP